MSEGALGALRNPARIEKAALETIRHWMPRYLEILEERGEIAVAQPASYEVVSEYNRLPEQALPAVIAVCPGSTGTPVQRADEYEASFRLEVGIELSAASEGTTREGATLLATAALGIVIHNPSLGLDDVRIEKWRGWSSTLVDSNDQRTRVGVSLVFDVLVERVVSTLGAGADPLPDEWPEITEVSAEVQPYGPEGS